jgi:hypothetical protein
MNSINRDKSPREMRDNLYNWQFYIQESKAKEERREEKQHCKKELIYT